MMSLFLTSEKLLGIHRAARGLVSVNRKLLRCYEVQRADLYLMRDNFRALPIV